MAWSFVGVGTAVTVTTTAHALTLPAGTADGDLLVAVISSRIASTTSITLPAGWALVGESKTNNVVAAATTSEASGMMAYIVRGASAPALTFTHPTAPSVAMGRIVAYRGQKATSPFDVGTGAKTATNITAVSVTGLTTAEASELIVCGVCSGRASAFSVFDATDPATSSGSNSVQTAAPITGTWQERQDASTTTGADTALAIADAVRSTAGATGNFTCTATVAGGHAVVAGAFKIEPPPPPSTVVQTGSTLYFNVGNGNTGTVSSTITVPSDADFMLVGFCAYNSASGYFTGGNMKFPKGGTATNLVNVPGSVTVDTGAGFAAPLFYMVAPDTGTNKTLTWDWTGTGIMNDANNQCSITFWKNVDPTSPIRHSVGAISGGTAPYTGGPLNAVSGDKIVAWATSSTSTEGTVSAWAGGLTTLIQGTLNVTNDSAWATADAGGTIATVGVQSTTNWNDGSCVTVALTPGATGVTGTLVETEDIDVSAFTGTVNWQAALAASEGLDVLASAGTVRWAATLAAPETADVAAFTGTVRWSANLAAPETADAAVFFGSTQWVANLAASEGADVAAFTGAVLVPLTGPLTVTEGADTGAFTGGIYATGTLTVTEGVDTAGMMGAVAWVATLAVPEAADTAALIGTVRWVATLAAIEAADVAGVTASVRWLATLATTEAPDVAALTGTVRWTGPLAASETADVAALTGTVQWVATLTAPETADAGAFLGAVRWTATLAVSEGPDTAAFTGGIYASGPLATTETADVYSGLGTIVGAGVNANLAAVEAPDGAVMTGAVTGVAGTLATTEAGDIAAMTGAVRWSATLATTEAPDVAALTGAVRNLAVLGASEGADTAAFSGAAITSGTLASAEAPDSAAFVGSVSRVANLIAFETPDATAFTGAVAWSVTLDVGETPDLAAFTGAMTNKGDLAVTEEGDSAAFVGGFVSSGVLVASEDADTAKFTSRPPDIQEAEGRILARESMRVRSLASAGQRMRTLKYPVPRPRELLNNYGDREREFIGQRTRKLVRA